MAQEEDRHVTSVRLTRKFAEEIDGVDLSRSQVGDRLDLPARDARMLIAEGWAMPVTPDASPATLSTARDTQHIRGDGSRTRRP